MNLLPQHSRSRLDILSTNVSLSTSDGEARSRFQMFFSSSAADRFGMALSGICLVHCLALPLLVPMLTVVASHFAFNLEHEALHLVLALLIVPTTCFAAWNGYKHHGSMGVVALLIGGAVVITLAALLGEQFPSEFYETTITTAGSLLLITGHWQNRRQCAVAEGCTTH